MRVKYFITICSILIVPFIEGCNEEHSEDIKGLKEYIIFKPIIEVIDSNSEKKYLRVLSDKLNSAEYASAIKIFDSLSIKYLVANDSTILVEKKSFITSYDYFIMYGLVRRYAKDTSPQFRYN